MNEAAVKKQLVSLARTILTLPASGTKKKGPKGTYLAEIASEKASLDETLQTLRLQVKYLVFDLEATRRENRYLRRMLEARPPRDRERDRDADGPSSF